MKRKLAFVMMVTTLALFALGIYLIFISRNKGEEYSHQILSQQNYEGSTLAFARGDILDRNGATLATNDVVYNLILDPSVIMTSYRDENDELFYPYKETTIKALCEVYGYDEAELTAQVTEKAEGGSMYYRCARHLTEDEKLAFEAVMNVDEDAPEKAQERAKKIRGVYFEREFKRVYPYDTLANVVLGYSNADGTVGSWGIEQYYNDELVGINGREYGYLNSDNTLERVVKEPENGHTIVTTLDFQVQREVQTCIQDFMKETSAKNVGVVVMDPRTGEILALGTDSQMNCNDPTDLSAYYTSAQLAAMEDDEITELLSAKWRNFCISDTYEPGSTVKVFTVSAVLEEAVVDPDEYSFVCDGENQIAEAVIHCNGIHGLVNLKQSLMYSCNDTMMDLAATMGIHNFVKYQRQFGVGMRTGVDLPGEADTSAEAGMIYTEDNMGPVDLATNAFGQNYNVTMIQVAAAYASLLNGGYYYQPHIVRQILNSDGVLVKEFTPTLVRQTVSASTSSFIREALYGTVEEGTGYPAQVAGYEVGGKTGTAQKYPRADQRYLVSFVGFVPADDPQVMIYVVVDEPDVENQDQSIYASSLEQKIMTAILPYLNIYPTRDVAGTTPEETPQGETTVPGEDNSDGDSAETQGEPPEGGGGEGDGGEGSGEGTLEEPTGASPSYTENYPDGIF